MIIMFIIAATTSVGAVATLYMASSYCIDACCRLRMDRISKRDKANAWNARLGRKIAQVRLTWACVLSSTHLSKSLAAALRQCEPQPCFSAMQMHWGVPWRCQLAAYSVQGVASMPNIMEGESAEPASMGAGTFQL